MRIERARNINASIKRISPDSVGYNIMRDKASILAFNIYALDIKAMNILKQEALSLGAELATPRNAILGKQKNYDCLLFGHIKALKLLAKKLLLQPFGLKELGKDLVVFLRSRRHTQKEIMSIINVDSNSFYKSYSLTEAIDRIYKDIELGADIIDIGAASTRPGSKRIESSVELWRLKDVFKEVATIDSKVKFSIDTYNAEVAKVAINSGFSIINDISGDIDNMLDLLKENKHISYILMHIKGTPESMQDLCNYDNLILDIDSYFQKKLEILYSHDIHNIMLDIGIGFAKNALQNATLITNLAHFKHFNKPLLVGASHKSFLATFSNDSNPNRLEATLVTHFFALQNGADIIRVHDVDAHKKMLALFNALHANDIDSI